MKAKELIKALETLDPESKVVINIMQRNKKYGVIQLQISDSCHSGAYSWVNRGYGGSITVHLPEGAYIAKLPK